MLTKIKDKIGWNWLFFIITLLFFISFWFIDFEVFKKIFSDFYLWIKKILPILFLVYFFIFIFWFFLENKKIKNFLENWWFFIKLFFSLIWWIFSSWPLYLWYPILKQLKDKWLNESFLVIFIYARAIKIPLFMIMISYFWLNFTLIFNWVLIMNSILIWYIYYLINNLTNNFLWKKTI